MNMDRFILFLTCIPGMTDVVVRKLITSYNLSKLRFTSRNELCTWLTSSIDSLSCNVFITPKTLEVARDKRIATEEKLTACGCAYISCLNPAYPSRLSFDYDFPVVLFFKGNISLLNSKKTCAVIGTREPSDMAVDKAVDLTSRLVKSGFTVVSGLAKGCDTVAHQTCLDNGGKTVAVLGTGIDTIYPSQNKQLADSIVAHDGLLISEYAPAFPFTKESFVLRDRIQAMTSDCVVVIQSSVNGGTMHAARATKRYRRDLYVVDPATLCEQDCDGNSYLLSDKSFHAVRV